LEQNSIIFLSGILFYIDLTHFSEDQGNSSSFCIILQHNIEVFELFPTGKIFVKSRMEF